MRFSLLALCVAAAGLTGCQADCGSANAFNSFTYRVFANPFESTSDNQVFTSGPEFWSYGVPANGVSDWQFQWGGSHVGPVTVVIDDQSFEGEGDLDTVECGLATVRFSGVYFDEPTEVEHTFNASMALALWSENGVGKLGAYLIWKESWIHPSSEAGQFTANSHLTGDLVGQGG